MSSFISLQPSDVSRQAQPEAFRIRLVGQPLRRSLQSDQRTSRSQETDLELLFEVRSEDGRRQPWTVQRGYEELARLNQQLTTELSWAALPRFPEVRNAGGVKRLFRSSEAEERNERELAKELEEYLNTLLAIPNVSSCTILELFLNIPQACASQEACSSTAMSAHQIGEAAADNVVGACAGLSRALRSFCAALRERLRLQDEEEEVVVVEETIPTGPDASQTSVRQLRAEYANRRAPLRQQNSVREAVLSPNCKLEEWK